VLGLLPAFSLLTRAKLGALAALVAGAAIGLGASAAQAADTCGRTRFIAVYDSHGLTPFGDRMDAWLMAYPGSELASYTLGGASPNWLLRQPVSPRGYVFNSCEGKPLLARSKLPERSARTPVLEDLLRVPEGTYERQVVILTLGSNVPGAPSVQTAPVETIVRTIAARPDAVCIWVGPPSIRSWSADYTEKVYQAIRDGIHAAEAGNPSKGPACHLIDSRRFSTYPAGGDGTHYGFSPSAIAAAHRWADGVAGEIDRILRPQPQPQPQAFDDGAASGPKPRPPTEATRNLHGP
jgi:hypothetical protein